MKKWMNWKVVFVVLGSILLLVTGYGIYLYNEVRSTFDAIHEPLVLSSKEPEDSYQSSEISSNEQPLQQEQQNEIESAKPLTVLLLGIDTDQSKGRADTILVLTLNPAQEAMKILSIPRDTYTEIVGFDFEDKINHSYAFGGVETSLLTVENLIDIPIDYVVSVNMEGFVEMVDIVGGVDVVNDMNFIVGDYHFPEGTITLSGEEALVYVRMRKEDPRGDFGRQMRQRDVLESIFNKAVSFNIVWQAPTILKTIRENVQTNLTFDEMIEFQSTYKSTLDNIEHLKFSKGDGHVVDGIWYYFLDEDELQEVRDALQDSLM